MFIARTLTILSLSAVALIATSQSAQADPAQDFFRKVSKVQVQIGGGYSKGRPAHYQPNPGYGRPGYGRPGCDRQVCPPPVRRCVYCVYYLDCHRHWHLYGTFQSRWSANEAERRLQHQGYRTYTKVKHVGGYPGPVVYNR